MRMPVALGERDERILDPPVADQLATTIQRQREDRDAVFAGDPFGRERAA